MTAAVVLAGGRARRLLGALKPALPVGGRPMLVRVLDAASSASPRIVVGPAELAGLLPEDVRLTSEQPPGGGPVAGIAAGVRLVPDGVEAVAVLAADHPFLTPTVLDGLRAGLDDGAEVAMLVDGDGRRQWLCAVWRGDVLRHRLAEVGPPQGVRVRDLVGEAVVREVAAPVGAAPPPWFDCDTDTDLHRAREWSPEA